MEKFTESQLDDTKLYIRTASLEDLDDLEKLINDRKRFLVDLACDDGEETK